MKSGISPCTLPREEKNTSDMSHLNVKTTEMNTNGEVELQISSDTASSNKLVSVDISNSMGDQVNHNTVKPLSKGHLGTSSFCP